MKEQRTNNLHISKQQWLTIRNEKFISTLFGDEPIIIEDFSFEIKGPEYGWLDMTFKTEGQKPFFMSASDVYPPFPAIRFDNPQINIRKENLVVFAIHDNAL